MSKSATAAPVTVMPSEKTWAAIIKLAQQGQDCEKRIDDLQKSRASVKRQLSEMGTSPKTTDTEEWGLLSKSLTLSELGLDSSRAKLKEFSTTQNALVCDAAQGKVFSDEQIEKLLSGHKDGTAPLYEQAMKSARDAGVKPEVGESDADAAKRKQPSPLDVPVAKGTSGAAIAGQAIAGDRALQLSLKLDAGVPVPAEWRNVGLPLLCNLIGIKERGSLHDAGLMTAADIEKFIYTENRPLAGVPGMTRMGAQMLTGWISDRRSEPTQVTAAAAADAHPGTTNGKHAAAEKPSKGKGAKKGGAK